MNRYRIGRATRPLLSLGVVAAMALTFWCQAAVAQRSNSPTPTARPTPGAGVALNAAGGGSDVMRATAFTDLRGQTFGLRDIRSHAATVFLFVSVQCPISNRYMPRVRALAAQLAEENVQTFAVYSDFQESRADIEKNVKEHRLSLPVIRDTGASLASAVGATVTPEAVVVDAWGAIRYRGRIDDNPLTTRVTSPDLAIAVNAVRRGEPVPHATLLSVGCAIRRALPTKTVLAGAPTYARDVAPILRAKCERCHRAGELAPFTLQNYKQASAWAVDIKRYTQSGQMPPWKPANDYGALKDVATHTLSEREKTILAQWADAGAPSGDPKETPAPATFTAGWQSGTPDVVLQPEKAFHLSEDGDDVYRNFIVKTSFPEDRWLRSVECRPGNRAVVHHIVIYIDANHAAEKLEGRDKDGQPGFTATGGGPDFAASGVLGGWAPGNETNELPQGVGTVLPRGANLVIQVHYHKDGKPETDLSKIGLFLAHSTIDKAMRFNLLLNMGFKIPYGDDHYEMKATTELAEDCHLLSVTPHMHLLGRSMQIWATLPDGTEKPLLWIKDWDFDWQMSYPLNEPMPLPKGSKVHLLAYYDNSDKNPRNPNRSHPRTVTWGEQTTDEMCIAFVTYTNDAEHLSGSTNR